MAEQEKNNKENYRKVRDEFDSLKIEEKAAFLVESTFSMLVHGIEAVGNVFSEQINKVCEEDEAEEKPKQKAKSSPKTRKTTRKRTTTSKKTETKDEE